MSILRVFAVGLAFALSAAPSLAQRFPLDAGSWGGKLRAGPSVNSRDIGSLREGEPITLLSREPEMFNGYPWFRIRTQSGREGYQWGGIICGLDGPIDGAFETCDTDFSQPVPKHAEVPAGAVDRRPARIAGANSAYTDVDFDRCSTLFESEEGGSVSLHCPGYGEEYPVIYLEGDGRVDIDPVADDGDFTTLSPFNRLGGRLEWRLDRSKTPFALIYRLSTATPEVPKSSTLFVKSVPSDGQPGCLVAKVQGDVPDANAVARQRADLLAPTFRCGVDRVVWDR